MSLESSPLLVSDVAKILDDSPDYIRHLERTKQLPAEKTPTGVRIFRLDDVERFARDRAQRREDRAARQGR
jgi:DNA-binding transcriptional MerR regulator